MSVDFLRGPRENVMLVSGAKADLENAIFGAFDILVFFLV